MEEGATEAIVRVVQARFGRVPSRSKMSERIVPHWLHSTTEFALLQLPEKYCSDNKLVKTLVILAYFARRKSLVLKPNCRARNQAM